MICCICGVENNIEDKTQKPFMRMPTLTLGDLNFCRECYETFDEKWQAIRRGALRPVGIREIKRILDQMTADFHNHVQ